MTQIEAIYQSGVFRPLGQVLLSENQRVRLNIERLDTPDVQSWLDEARELQQRLLADRRSFPDSTLDIAADRMRDE